jgi:hypothetical protein
MINRNVHDVTDWAIYTRDSRRYRVPPGIGAWLEIECPEGGAERARFQVHDLSWGGIAFDLPNDHTLSPGTQVANAIVGIGRARVAGSIEILHVTPDVRLGTLCGGRFRPASGLDETALDQLLARLDHLTSRGLWIPA